jgi:hypothetical protein
VEVARFFSGLGFCSAGGASNVELSEPKSGQSELSVLKGSSFCAFIDETSSGTNKLVKMVHIRTILIKRII